MELFSTKTGQKPVSTSKKTFNVEGLMLNVARSLIRDFRDNLSEPSLYEHHYKALAEGDIKTVRASVPACNDQTDSTAKFKADYQISSLFKRYRFKKDLFSDQELETMSIDKFLHVQDHILNVSRRTHSEFTKRGLAGARIYIAKVLGVYNDEEHRALCRFGKRASVGIPARDACEAARWELPITGSHEQITWFDSEMSHVDCVQEYWAAQIGSDLHRSTYQVTSSLKMTLVPKSFKSLRTIMPNTTIGSYMSYGLGVMMRKRLKRVGYDISTLQQSHKYLAMRGSVHSMYTTADLSSASDTISVALVRNLFPSDWFDVLEQSRIGVVELPDGRCIESQTFCTMGVGYTFPLQTLVFLSILKSLAIALTGKCTNKTISVYGDDMIYPTSFHSTVVTLFEEIGFVINLDKTFHEGNFRESCGGDYHHGRDVRPFQPRNGPVSVGKTAYEAVLYKFINGLLMRWTEYEVAGTLQYLLSEIGRVTYAAKVVPVDFPDESGIKCPNLHYWQFLANRSDVSSPKHVGHGLFRFSYLRFTPDSREEVRHAPFLWLALNADSSVYRYHSDTGNWELQHASYPDVPNRLKDVRDIMDIVSPIKWVKHATQTTRSKLTGCRYNRLLSYVTISHSGKYTRHSGTSGFEDRRQHAF